MIENLKLVIFDMDGLMFNTEQVYCDAVLDVVKKYKIDVDERVLQESIGSSHFDTDKFFYKGIPEGIDMDGELNDAIKASVDNMCTFGVPKKPGLNELLKMLTDKGYKLVVATSTPIKRSGRLLKSSGVMDLLDFVITGEQVERGKPSPDIFLMACEKAGIPPENALVLEDSNNGGRAARAAGIKYIIVPDINKPAEDVVESAYAVVENLHDVLRLIFN